MRRAFVQIQCPTNPAFAFRGDTRSCPDPLLETHLVAPIDGESILLLECALLGPLRAYALLGLGEIEGGGQVRHPVLVLSSVVACGSVWDLSFLQALPELPTVQYYVEAECHHTAVLRGFAVHFRLPLRLLLSCPSAALVSSLPPAPPHPPRRRLPSCSRRSLL